MHKKDDIVDYSKMIIIISKIMIYDYSFGFQIDPDADHKSSYLDYLYTDYMRVYLSKNECIKEMFITED